MLSGYSHAVYDGGLGQQPQVWRIVEHHYHPPSLTRRSKKISTYSRSNSSSTSPTPMDISDEEVEVEVEDSASDGDMLTSTSCLAEGPAGNAFFPLNTKITPFADGIMVEAEGRPPTFYKTWTGEPWDDRRDHFASPVREDETPPTTTRRLPYDQPKCEGDEDEEGMEWDQELNDIIITGTVGSIAITPTFCSIFCVRSRVILPGAISPSKEEYEVTTGWSFY